VLDLTIAHILFKISLLYSIILDLVYSMINVKSAEFLIGVITFLLAYLIAVTLAGCFRAWVAKKMGDSTGENMGFLTLNPLVHIDPLGILFLILFYFGWGRRVPINPFNITSPSRTIKLVFAYLSDTIAHFFLALCGLVLLVATFDVHVLDIARYMILTRNVSHLYIAHLYPNASSLTVSLAFIVVALIYLNFILGVLDLIINACSIIMLLVLERSPHYARYNTYITVFLPILLILFFSEPLRFLAVNFISYAGYTIAHALCIA